MKIKVKAMVSPEQWGACDPLSRTMLEDAGIQIIRNEQKRLLTEDEMKELERNLVQLLVEQQKKLLSVLQTSKSNSKAAKKKASMDESQRKMLTD